MSDFLKNLRSSHKKEPSNLRKPYDNHFYPQQDRRMNRDRRPPVFNDNQVDAISRQQSQHHSRDLMPEILENLTNISDQLERLVASTESLNEAKTQQSLIVSDFFTALQTMMSQERPRSDSAESRPMATTSYASGTHYTKDEILSTIRDMRKQGATFAIIADYLREKGIPTFSGRGEWHAQTIHRLCK